MFAVDLEPGSSLNNHTGTWRTETPRYRTLTPPCEHGCASEEPVREWLSALQLGTDQGAHDAWNLMVSVNPLPATMGRICYASCESACNRTQLGGSILIREIEGILGEHALREGWALPAPRPSTQRNVAVIGSGPRGISAMYQLHQAGHNVTLFESQNKLGGTLSRSISENRLPQWILHGEINRIVSAGVTVHMHNTIRHISNVMDQFDGFIWATGASMCMAIVDGETIWRQPVHIGGRQRRTSTLSIGRGRAAALALTSYLASTSTSVRAHEPMTAQEPVPSPTQGTSNTTEQTPSLLPLPSLSHTVDEPAILAQFDLLNHWYYEPAENQLLPNTPPRSGLTPAEFINGQIPRDLVREALRCMSCGSCFECDNCYAVCPDNAIVKVPGGYVINEDYCKGCGICVEECPSGAIELIALQR